MEEKNLRDLPKYTTKERSFIEPLRGPRCPYVFSTGYVCMAPVSICGHMTVKKSLTVQPRKV